MGARLDGGGLTLAQGVLDLGRALWRGQSRAPEALTLALDGTQWQRVSILLTGYPTYHPVPHHTGPVRTRTRTASRDI